LGCLRKTSKFSKRLGSHPNEGHKISLVTPLVTHLLFDACYLIRGPSFHNNIQEEKGYYIKEYKNILTWNMNKRIFEMRI